MKHYSVKWSVSSPATYATSTFNDSRKLSEEVRNFSSLERATDFKEELEKAATVLKINYHFVVNVSEVVVED